jgi:hypothetical protein
VANCDETAAIVSTALIMFDFPPLMKRHSLDELRDRAEKVVELLLQGLKKG